MFATGPGRLAGVRERSTREMKIWHSLKGEGRVGLGEGEERVLRGSCLRHEALGGAAELAGARAALCKQAFFAAMQAEGGWQIGRAHV